MDVAADTLMVVVSDPASGCRVLVEDDGRVVYAYLLDADGEIVSDAWLYNRAPTPSEPMWHDRDAMPFLNPAEYVRSDVVFDFFTQPSDVVVLWEPSEQYGPIARIYLHRELFGILTAGTKPGWSVLAAKNGPLARKFTADFGGLVG